MRLFIAVCAVVKISTKLLNDIQPAKHTSELPTEKCIILMRTPVSLP